MNSVDVHVFVGIVNLVIKNTDTTICCDYTNHRGEKSKRCFRPIELWYGASLYHGKDEMLFLEAYDCDKMATRSFKVDDFDFTTASVEVLQ